MRHFQYQTRGTCSKTIDFDLDDEQRVHNISYFGGCHGNLQAVSRLCEGLTAEEVISRLKGINCGNKGTSCGDQLSKALEKALVS